MGLLYLYNTAESQYSGLQPTTNDHYIITLVTGFNKQ
jgi:hypothetical protein